jgi:hypothetical protein
MFESFVILEFPEPEDSDILFLESSRDTIISHDEAGDISGYREAFENLRTISLHPDGTLSYLADLAKQIAQQARQTQSNTTEKVQFMLRTDPSVLMWHKSPFSQAGHCVEVATKGEAVLIRDSKNQEGPILSVSSSAWRQFVEVIRRDVNVQLWEAAPPWPGSARRQAVPHPCQNALAQRAIGGRSGDSDLQADSLAAIIACAPSGSVSLYRAG